MMNARTAAVVFIAVFYCASVFCQNGKDANELGPGDLPNIEGHFASAKALIGDPNPKMHSCIPSSTIEVLFIEKLEDTTNLRSRILDTESLESLAAIYKDSDYSSNTLAYMINDQLVYGTDDGMNPYNSMITASGDGVSRYTLSNKSVTIQEEDGNISVLIMDKVILPSSSFLNKSLSRSMAYADSILYPNNLGKDKVKIDERDEKYEQLIKLGIDGNFIFKTLNYYREKVDLTKYTKAEISSGLPVKDLTKNDSHFESLVKAALDFSKEYVTTQAKFDYLVKPLLSKEEYYDLIKFRGFAPIQRDNCDFDGKWERATHMWELLIAALEADRTEDFFRMYDWVIRRSDLGFFSNTPRLFMLLDTLGLEVAEFAIGLTVAVQDVEQDYWVEEVADLISAKEHKKLVFESSLRYIEDPSIDTYNKFRLVKLLRLILDDIRDGELKDNLIAKYDTISPGYKD